MQTQGVSLIINTACGDAVVGSRSNPFRTASYASRAALLEKVVLPRCTGFDDVIVAGSIPPKLDEAFPDVRFVDVQPARRDRWDALLQREVGARFASGHILVFCHDDHAPGEGLADYLRNLPLDVDILVPNRVHLKTGATLINGRERPGLEPYMGGHCYAMRRWIWAAVPLTNAPDEFWDIYLTPLWKKAGANIVWDDSVCHYDCEALEGEL